MLKIEARGLMHMPNTAAFQSLENLESVQLEERGVEIVTSFGGHTVLLFPLVALWNGDMFAGFLQPRPGIADAGRLISEVEINRINDAIREGRVLSSREVEGSLEAARAELTLEDVPYLEEMVRRESLVWLDDYQILSLAFGIDRWEGLEHEADCSWYRAGGVVVGVSDEGEMVYFYRRKEDGNREMVAGAPAAAQPRAKAA